MMQSRFIISDYTSLLVEAIFTQKDVILIDNDCKVNQNLSKIGLAMLSFVKYASKPKEILNILNNDHNRYIDNDTLSEPLKEKSYLQILKKIRRKFYYFFLKNSVYGFYVKKISIYEYKKCF